MSRIHAFMTSAMVAVAACGAPDEYDIYSEEEVNTAQQPITGGSIGGGKGVVRVDIQNGGGCTGALIGPRLFVTAAHCFDGVAGNITSTSLQANVMVRYTTNGNDFFCISGAGSSGACSGWNTASVRRQSRAYALDVGKDFAVVRIAGSWPSSISSTDYRRLWLDHITTADEYRQYGAGVNNNGTSLLMKYLHDKPNELSANQIRTVGSSARPCIGDSGGPLLWHASLKYIFGLHAIGSGSPCSAEDENFRAHRIKNEDIDLIDILGSCERSDDPRYAKCY